MKRWKEKLWLTKQGEVIEIGPHTCPLCLLFFFEEKGNRKEKNIYVGCPIQEATGLSHCKGTPYAGKDGVDKLWIKGSSITLVEQKRLVVTVEREYKFLSDLFKKWKKR